MARSQSIFKKFYQRKLNKSHFSLFQAQIRPMDIMGIVTGNLTVHCIKTALFEDTFLDNNRAIISSCYVCFACWHFESMPCLHPDFGQSKKIQSLLFYYIKVTLFQRIRTLHIVYRDFLYCS